GQALELTNTVIVAKARFVAPDQDLIGFHYRITIDLSAGDDETFAIGAVFEVAAFAHRHGKANDRVISGLTVNFGEHDVGFDICEKTGALHRRQLEGVAENQNL